MDITKLNVVELKALAFDISQKIELEKNNYRLVLNQLQKLLSEKTEPQNSSSSDSDR